jgi:hypothetical protein
MPEDNENGTQETQEGANTETSTQDGKNDESSQLKQFTQAQLDEMFRERASRAKSSVLKDVGVDDMDTLLKMKAAYDDFEKKRIETEEANKTEVEKLQDALNSSKNEHSLTQNQVKLLRVENAIMRLAPDMGIGADRFEGLIALMPTGEIKMGDDNTIEDEQVKKAIEATVAKFPYLKAEVKEDDGGKKKGGKLNGKGSPLHNHQQMTRADDKPVEKRRRKVSI